MRKRQHAYHQGKGAAISLGLVIIFCFNILKTFAQEEVPAAEEGSWWVWTLLGRFHPLIVHFPIGLLLFGALLEVFTLRRFDSPLRPAIKICMWIGTVTAAFAAAFGWLLSQSGDYGGGTLDIHQWTGISTAALGALSLILLYRAHRPADKRRGAVMAYRSVLFITAVGVTVSGHYGASLTHGEDYISSVLPWNTDGEIPKQLTKIDFASFASDSAVLDVGQQSALQMNVKSIFAHNCYKCHGAEKVKGDLRLDNKEMMFRGGESGAIFEAGHPENSEIMRRLTLPAGHKEAMPPKGKRLSEKEIGMIEFWISKGVPWPDEDEEKMFRTAALEPRNPPLPAASGGLNNPVDIWVNDYFGRHDFSWPQVVDDRIFLRRIYLDIIGLLPKPAELEAFAADPRPDKRELYVKQLLDRNDDYAQHWLTFWNDALRNDYTGTGYITGGRSDITDWLYTSLRGNKPYDEFVEQLISPVKESRGFIEGIQWRGVVNASQRTEIQAAQNVSQVFLGLNLKCASCHNSFINKWKLDEAYAFANIFSDTSLEINRCDKPTGKFTKAKMLWEQLGEINDEAPSAVKQKQLAEIITKPENGRLSRTIVNRIWAQMMGRGLVEPVDVMDNEPWSQDLLDWLAYNFVSEGKYDLKRLIYLIATSRTYQLPSVAFADVNRLTSSDFVFTGMVRRRMTAEQFSDAVSMVVSPVFADSLVKFDPFKGVAVASDPLPGPRASLVVNNRFLTSLGRPNRENVSTGRESQANLLQALELTNGEQFNAALRNGAAKWMRQYRDPGTGIREIYRNALGRLPTEGELKAAISVMGTVPKAENYEDLLWAVMLLPEFQLIY